MHFLMAVALIAPSVTSTAYAVETTSQQSSEAVTSTTDSSRKQEPIITQETTDIKQEAPNQATSDSVKQSQETTAPAETTNLETSTAEKEETSTPQKITILGTSDVHGQLWNWSYEDDKELPVGLSQVSTVVNQVRAQNPAGTVLIDNGDNIQGTILTDDLYNKAPLVNEKTHPMITAMNVMKYDAMVLGNHEFNFGLPLIQKIQKEAAFPILSANTYNKEDGRRFVKGTTTKELDFNQDGQPDLKVGIIGLTIPHIPLWDGPRVTSLNFLPLKEEAEKAVTELKANDQADIIVASIHAGQQNSDPAASADQVIENVAGIDAYILGHDHLSFTKQGAAPNGKTVPVGGPKDTGTEVVKIDLSVAKNADKWEVQEGTATIVPTTNVPADEAVKAATKEYHEQTRAFIQEEIGTATADFLPKQEIKGIPEAQLQPTAMISLINNVQKEVTGAQLSAAALFKYDSKLPAGKISYATIFDIYKYPNTLVSVPINGENLLKYLEKQGAYYNQTQPDDLTISFNPNIRVYNYDMISGVDYKIDISKPVGERIVDAKIDGQPLDPAKEYTIAMNNYRYGGLASQGIQVGEPIKNSDPETLRGMIVDYIKKKGTLDPEQEIERNWSIIGTNFDEKWRTKAIELVNDGTLQIPTSPDGRTPNAAAITKQDVRNAGFDLDNAYTIMHTNDVHGRLEAGKGELGMARLKTFKDQENPTLMVDAGDVFQGLPISNFSKGADMAKAMNEVGYDAMAVGNHEFDFGLEIALGYKDQLNFPILSSNTYYKDGSGRVFDPYTIVEKAGKKFAIVGVTTPETATKTHPKNVEKVTFKDPIPEVEAVINEIKEKYADIQAFVVTGHLGVDETTPHIWRGDTLAETLSQTYPELDINVIDGHSHTAVESGKRYGKVIYAQTGNYLNNVGIVTAPENELTKKTAKLIPAEELLGLPENPAVKAIVDEARTNFNAENEKVIVNYIPFTLDGQRENVRTRETNLGNLIGDAIMSYGQDAFSQPADFAVTNGGGIRADIKQGPIKVGDVIAVLPFGNSIAQIQVTGAQVKEMFEMSVRSIPQKDENGTILLDDAGQPKLGANGGFLHVSSSIRIHYDSTKPGTRLASDEGNETGQTIVGSRVLGIEIKNRQTQKFEPLDEKKQYRMATNDFLAAGGDGYDMLGGEREEGISLDAVLIEYLKSATSLRLYRAATTIDLAQYKEPFPGERIVSISEEAYKELIGGGETPTPDPKPDPKPTPETPVATNKQNQAGARQSNPSVTEKKKYGGFLPKTGTETETLALYGLLFVGLSSSGWYIYKRRNKAS